MPKLLYVDTNILIYLLERHERYSEAVAWELDEFAKNPGAALITSAITVAEFLAGTKATSLDILRKVPRLKFAVLDEELAEKAGKIKRQSSLQIGDAVHLATAISVSAEAFFTNDKKLANIVAKHMQVKQLTN